MPYTDSHNYRAETYGHPDVQPKPRRDWVRILIDLNLFLLLVAGIVYGIISMMH